MMILFVILLFIITIILGIDTYYLYSFSDFWSIAEPVVIYIFSVVALIGSIIANSQTKLKRAVLRLSFFVFLFIFILNIIRGIIWYKNGATIQLLMYINTLLYVFICALLLLIGYSLFQYRKGVLREKYELNE